ncbi:hypothetical protein R9X47_27160 [Wukongibacter baidiensis]|uniref:hypothetical protein n=1 Tax=Wukongibacter baidiensis TaxID=1723361 RepID=UPI003D7F4C96
MGFVLGLLLSATCIGITKFISYKFGLSAQTELVIITLLVWIGIYNFGKLKRFYRY